MFEGPGSMQVAQNGESELKLENKHLHVREGLLAEVRDWLHSKGLIKEV